MAISGKDVQVWMWRAFKFSTRCVYTLVKNHPFVSCPLLFFLVLYICFPSFFWISLYSSVFLVLAVSVTRIYLRHRNAKSLRRDEKISDAEYTRKDDFGKNDATKNGNEKSFSRARSVRRRKPQKTSRDSSVHTSEDEKNTVFSSTINNDLVDKSALTEERPKEIREIEVDSIISQCSSSTHPSGLRPDRHDTLFSEGPRKFGGGSGVGGGDTEIESSEGTDEEDEQEREANNKAVQWTEADQKNLMDLGFSEIERNKRLESLIARRRARKLLSLQVRRSLVNMDSLENHVPMTSLMIPRCNNPFIASQSTGNFSPMPSSAPSVLLPNQNPFDLPYEPQEEKPNLTGGSFHLEFKDMTFSRHESAASFPGEQKEDQQETSLSHESTKKDGVSDGLENSEVKGQLDEKDTDKIIEVESCQTPKSKLNTVAADKVIKEEVPDSKQGMDLVNNCREEKGSEVQTKSVVIEDSIDKLSSASSSEDDVPTFGVDKDAVLRSLASPLLRNMSLNREGSSQMECVGNKYDPSVFHKNNMQEHLYHVDSAMHHNHHTSISSIASDLQVEVSEVSSPALTDDGSISSPCGKFSAHRGDMVNESTTGNEDIRATSSPLPQIDESEPKEVHDTKDIEGDLKDTKQDKMDDSLAIEDSDGLESFEADGGQQHRAELRSSGVHPNLNNYQLQPLLPASVPQQFHIAASESSPRSVLQPNISIDPSPISNLSYAHVEVHQFHPERVENNMLDEAIGADLTCTLPQSTMSLMGDSRSHPLHEGSAEILEESSNHSTTKEANSTRSVGEDKVHENERRQNKTDYISEGSSERQESTNLSTSTKEANSSGSVCEDMVHENERRQNETNYIPEGSSGRQESSSLSTSAKEDNSTGSVSEDMVHENERRQNKTSYIPVGSSERQESSNLSSSAKEDNPAGSVSQKLTHENEIKPNGVKVIPKGSSQELSSLDSTAALSKLQKEMNSDLPDVGQEYSNFLTSAKEANSIGSVNKQAIHEDDKKQNETKDVPEGSPNNFNYDSKAALSKLAEESNSCLPVLAANEDANLMGTMSEQVFPESERRQNETRDISEGRLESSSPESTVTLSKGMGEISSDLSHTAQESSNLSASPEEANSMKFVNQEIIHENGEGQNEAKDIPEVSSQVLSSSDAAAVLSEPREEISSRSLTMTDDRSKKPHEHEADNEALPSSLNPVEQVNKLNAPIVNREGNPLEEKVWNSVDREAQASTNATTSKDSQDTMNELQQLGSQEDHAGLLILPETREVSTDKYPSESADEKEGGCGKPCKGESEILSHKEITEVEPSKSAEESYSPNNHMFSTETEITLKAPARRSTEEVTGYPNAENTVVSQMDGTSKAETVKEVPKV